MPSLREIKDRIGSVRSTLKITGAMKLVASAKLRKAQQAVQALRPYEAALSSILAQARGATCPATTRQVPVDGAGGRVAVVAVASNSSLCGSFNGNVVRRTLEFLRVSSASVGASSVSSGASTGASAGAAVDVFPIGRRVADPLRRAGYSLAPTAVAPSPGSDPASPSAASQAPSPGSAPALSQEFLNDLAAHPSYEAAASLAGWLAEAYNSGVYSRIVLIYNHFVTTSRQEVRCETWLPFNQVDTAGESPASDPVRDSAAHSSSLGSSASPAASSDSDYILEPSAGDIVDTLLPQVLRLKIYAMILDSIASEHAARLIAMQTATDNAQQILDELTLEYNKGRQQQITAEILDIVGGSRQ